jgi:hypothetical protein
MHSSSDEKQLRRPIGSAARRALAKKLATPDDARQNPSGIPTWEHPKVPTTFPDLPRQSHTPSKLTASPRHLQPNTNTKHQEILQMGGPRPDHMVITFDSDTASCCPSLGDITCDYTEAQLFAASNVTIANRYEDRPRQCIDEHYAKPKSPSGKPNYLSGLSQQQRKNQLHSSRKEVASPHQRKARVSSPRKDLPSSQQGKNDKAAPSKDGSKKCLPVAPKLVGPPSPIKQPERNISGGDIVFQMGGLSFREAPPDVNVASIAAKKKRAKATTNNSLNTSHDIQGIGEEIVLPANSALENIVLPLAPTFATGSKANSISGVADEIKRRSAGAPGEANAAKRLPAKDKRPENIPSENKSDKRTQAQKKNGPTNNGVADGIKRRSARPPGEATAKRLPAKDKRPVNKQENIPSENKSDQRTQVHKKNAPTNSGREIMTASEIEDACLRSAGKSSVATVRVANKRPGREIVLPGTSAKPTITTKERDFLPAPLHDNELCSSSEFNQPGGGTPFNHNIGIETTQTATASSTGTSKRDVPLKNTNSQQPQEAFASVVHENDYNHRRRQSSNGSKSHLQHDQNASASSVYSHAQYLERSLGNLEGSLHLGGSYTDIERSSRIDDGDDSASLALIKQENEMMKVTLERSLHDVSYHSHVSLASDYGSASSLGGSSFQVDRMSESGRRLQLIEDDSDSDGDDVIDMKTAIALSSAIMDESLAGMSRYSTSALQDSVAGMSRYSTQESLSMPSRHAMMNDSMSRYSSRGDLTSCASRHTMTTDSSFWRKDRGSGRWFMLPANADEGMDQSVTGDEMMIEHARELSVREAQQKSFNEMRDSISRFDDCNY